MINEAQKKFTQVMRQFRKTITNRTAVLLAKSAGTTGMAVVCNFQETHIHVAVAIAVLRRAVELAEPGKSEDEDDALAFANAVLTAYDSVSEKPDEEETVH